MGASNVRLGRLLSAGGLFFLSLASCSDDEPGLGHEPASGADAGIPHHDDAGDDSPDANPGEVDSGQQGEPTELERFSFFVKPRVGFSWPSDARRSWMSRQDEAGCGAGVNIDQETPPDPDRLVGSGG